MISNNNNGANLYALRQGNKTVSIFHGNRHYVIGFKNKVITRKVHYSMHPENKIIMLRDDNINLHDQLLENGYDLQLSMDVNATIFIPKCVGSILHPMNDGKFHIFEYKEAEFLSFPIEKNLGIAIPYKLQHEDEHEFTFKACVIDPINY
jgi:hypothetical protein